MHLIIDIGNTRAKVALFEENELIQHTNVDNLNKTSLLDIIANCKIEGAIISSTKHIDDEILATIRSKTDHLIQLSHTTPLPFKIGYKTPETLGRDRIAAIAGVYFMHPHQNILVIDAGTAITYDFINSKHVYVGGNIAPGVEMRLKSLQHFTDKLPLVAAEGEVPMLGYNTETAIRSGVIEGILFEMEGYIEKLRNEYGELLIFLTGGDAFYFDKRLKNIIFADLKLVVKGLNGILQYNAK